jgi:glutamine synthetase
VKIDELKRLARQTQAEYIDLKFSDLPGMWHHITMPISALGRALFTHGVGVDGSSLPGFSKIESGDMIAVPVPETVFVDPFFEASTISMICDIFDIGDSMSPYSRNPRRVAADAERYLRRAIKGATIVMGPEFEFYVFDKVNFYQGPESAFYFVDSLESEWNAAEDEENLGYKIPYKMGYHVAPPMDRTYLDHEIRRHRPQVSSPRSRRRRAT